MDRFGVGRAEVPRTRGQQQRAAGFLLRDAAGLNAPGERFQHSLQKCPAHRFAPLPPGTTRTVCSKSPRFGPPIGNFWVVAPARGPVVRGTASTSLPLSQAGGWHSLLLPRVGGHRGLPPTTFSFIPS